MIMALRSILEASAPEGTASRRWIRLARKAIWSYRARGLRQTLAVIRNYLRLPRSADPHYQQWIRERHLSTAELDRQGHVKSTEGSWEGGVDGALPGIVMPGNPMAPGTYRQEFYPGHAQDMAWIVDLNQSVKVPYQAFTGVLTEATVTVTCASAGLVMAGAVIVVLVPAGLTVSVPSWTS